MEFGLLRLIGSKRLLVRILDMVSDIRNLFV